MRYRNSSEFGIDRDLWTGLARPFRIDGSLPGAIADDLGLYVGKSLRVTIRPKLNRASEHPSGSYTCGHISLFPCPTCNPAFLTRVYLHELFHAWLDQVDEKLYLDWQHCETADAFADTAFTLLGGRIGNKCGGYRAALGFMRQRLPWYEAFVETLASLRGPAIKRWKAGREAERLSKFCS